MQARVIFITVVTSFFTILTFILLSLAFSDQFKHLSQETTKPKPLTRDIQWLHQDKQKLDLAFPLKPGHQLYMAYTDTAIPTGKLFDLNPDGTIKEIQQLNELTAILGPITTKPQAYAFVRFFTAEPTRFLLSNNPIMGINPEDAVRPIPPTMSALLSPADITMAFEQWIIERDVIIYPYGTDSAKLVRTSETLTATGQYTFSSKTVLAEGDDVNELLPYYK